MNAMDTAQELGVPIRHFAMALAIMQSVKVDGKAAHDHGGRVRSYEKLARVEVRN